MLGRRFLNSTLRRSTLRPGIRTRVVLVAVLLSVGACRRTVPSPAASRDDAAPTADNAAPESPTGLPPSAAPAGTVAEPTPPCAAAPLVAPATLLASWPSLVGRRVSVDGVVVERAVDFTQAVVIARGVRLAVLMSPDQRWRGRARRTFTVLGSTRISLHGRVVLPELVLEAEGGGCGS